MEVIRMQPVVIGAERYTKPRAGAVADRPEECGGLGTFVI